MGCFKEAKIVEYGSSSTVDMRCPNDTVEQHEENSFCQENLTRGPSYSSRAVSI
jgi:hypothetical protein